MKILVVNLLRLGDFVMGVPVINGLKGARRDAQVDVLAFAGSAGLKNMVPGIRRWWTLDREELQKGLGEADVPALTSFALLQETLDRINAEKYDLIVNLSSTRFSAWVAGYLKAPERLGLTFDLKGVAHFHSPWFRYLNDHAEPGDANAFHHTDVFLQACGLGSRPADWTMRSTVKGAFEVDALDLGLEPVVVFQLYTSDAKKNLSETSWLDLASCFPGHQLVCLGAPSEEARLTAFQRRAASLGVSVKVAILGLEGALELLNRSELLITGDTSIKHLANAAHCKVLEISVGSSDYRRTGAFKTDSLILQGRAACAPCGHSRPCGRPAHECALAVDSEAVAEAAQFLLREEWDEIEKLARRHPQMEWRRTRRLDSGFWMAQDLARAESAETVRGLIERSAWKMALNRGRDRGFLEFGSEGMFLRRELKGMFGDAGGVLAHLDFLEAEESRRGDEARSRLIELKRRAPRAGLVEIGGLRREQIALETEFEHSEFKTKLIRTLKLHWRESI